MVESKSKSGSINMEREREREGEREGERERERERERLKFRELSLLFEVESSLRTTSSIQLLYRSSDRSCTKYPHFGTKQHCSKCQAHFKINIENISCKVVF